MPVLGYLDDLIIVPGGIALALRLIPAKVMEQARLRARETVIDKRAGVIGTAIIITVWILAIILCALLIRRLLRKPL